MERKRVRIIDREGHGLVRLAAKGWWGGKGRIMVSVWG